MSSEQIVFAIVLALALGFFSYNAQRLVEYMRTVGGPDHRTDRIFTRLKNLIVIGLFQGKILRDPVAGILHASVFWGFVVLTLGTVEILIQGLVPGFTYGRILPELLYNLYKLSQIGFALLVLGAVGMLLYRRLVVKPRRLQGDRVHSGDAVFVLSMIAALMITLLIDHAFVTTHTESAWRDVNWWLHALLIMTFLNYLPYSKHLHVITSLPNTFLSNTSGPGQKGVMRYMDLEADDAEQFGASDVNHLTWKNLLDGYSCTECGRCTAACPANITGKVLSPRKIIVDTRQRLKDYVNGKPGRLLDDYITEEELWACTSCRACVYECPVSIDHLDIIYELKRNLVLMESRFPAEVQPAFESLERNGSPWAFNPADRADWASGMNIPTLSDMTDRGEKPEVLFWVGCMGSFDDRAKKITVAFARIMKASGIKFAILGQEEKCNGDPARRMGNEYLYQMLAKDNVETLNRYNVQTVVTICPHCFHQIGNEYPQLGGNYEVIHHSTYIERLLEEGRIPLDGEGKRLTIAYHDSCYLGRYNDIYDAPRETLRRSLPVVNIVEPKRTKDRGLCCGAGGGRMFMEETQGKRINIERTEELLATGADTLAVACPFCMTMISDGVRAKESDVPVLDISEVVAERLVTVQVS